MKQFKRAVTFLTTSVLFSSYLHASQTCQEAYRETAESYRKSSHQLLGLGVLSPSIGAGIATTGTIYYSAQEIRDSISAVATTEVYRAPQSTAYKLLIENPVKIVSSVIVGGFVAALGGPAGVVSAATIRAKASDMKEIADAFSELAKFSQVQQEISEATQLPKHLNRVFKTVNRRMGLSRFKPGHRRYVTKEKVHWDHRATFRT